MTATVNSDPSSQSTVPLTYIRPDSKLTAKASLLLPNNENTTLLLGYVASLSVPYTYPNGVPTISFSVTLKKYESLANKGMLSLTSSILTMIVAVEVSGIGTIPISIAIIVNSYDSSISLSNMSSILRAPVELFKENLVIVVFVKLSK